MSWLPERKTRIQKRKNTGMLPSCFPIFLSSRLPAFLLSCLLILSACGFQPVYSTRNAQTSLQHIVVETIAGREGQLLTIALEDALHPSGAPAAPHHHLHTTLKLRKQPIGIEPDRSVLRWNLYLTAEFTLNEATTGRVVLRDSARRISSYNVSESDFSSFVAEQDAIKRGIRELAHTIRLRLAAGLQK